MQVRKKQRDQAEQHLCDWRSLAAREPVIARSPLHVADEENEDHDDHGEDRRRGKSRDEQRECSEDRGFQINDRDAGNEVPAEGVFFHSGDDGGDHLGRGAGSARQLLRDCILLPRVKDDDEQHGHHDRGDEQQGEHAEELAEQVFEARDRLGEDGVKRPVLDIVWDEDRRGEHREQEGEDRHRAERHRLQRLELLLKCELHRHQRAADDDEREDEEEIKDLEPDELEERACRDGADAGE